MKDLKNLCSIELPSLSIRIFRDASDRSLFISSEVTDTHPFVHHCYIKDGKLHYIVYDPVDDILIEHHTGESISYTTIKYEKTASLNFFDLEAHNILKRIILAKTAYYQPPNDPDSTYYTKIMEDIALSINKEHAKSAGYLTDSHNLANSIVGTHIKRIMAFIVNQLLNMSNEAFNAQNNDMVAIAEKCIEVCDEISLSIINSQPIGLDTIKAFKQIITDREILDVLVSHPDFILLECRNYFDLMLGKSSFSDHENARNALLTR